MSKAAFLRLIAPAGLVLAAFAPQSHAATTGGSMSVSLAVAQSCTLQVAQNVNFGTQTPTTTLNLQAGVTANTNKGLLTVNCRKQNSPVTITLASASTASSSGGTMSNAGSGGSSTVAYNLYLPQNPNWNAPDLANCSYTSPTAWPGAGLTFNNWATTGAQNIAVCATTSIDQNTEAGTYTDTVNVTVTY